MFPNTGNTCKCIKISLAVKLHLSARNGLEYQLGFQNVIITDYLNKYFCFKAVSTFPVFLFILYILHFSL